jgi:hypothetical protein
MSAVGNHSGTGASWEPHDAHLLLVDDDPAVDADDPTRQYSESRLELPSQQHREIFWYLLCIRQEKCPRPDGRRQFDEQGPVATRSYGHGILMTGPFLPGHPPEETGVVERGNHRNRFEPPFLVNMVEKPTGEPDAALDGILDILLDENGQITAGVAAALHTLTTRAGLSRANGCAGSRSISTAWLRAARSAARSRLTVAAAVSVERRAVLHRSTRACVMSAIESGKNSAKA